MRARCMVCLALKNPHAPSCFLCFLCTLFFSLFLPSSHWSLQFRMNAKNKEILFDTHKVNTQVRCIFPAHCQYFSLSLAFFSSLSLSVFSFSINRQCQCNGQDERSILFAIDQFSFTDGHNIIMFFHRLQKPNSIFFLNEGKTTSNFNLRKSFIWFNHLLSTLTI